ncbi:MAG: hypothetical protein ACJ8BF_07460 [Gemmatimonadales bacterium]
MDIAIHVSVKRCAVALSLIVLLLVVASLGASYLSLASNASPLLLKIRDSFIRLVWLDQECNIPSWFSSCLLLAASFLLGLIALAHKQQDGDFSRWALLALIFAFLSLDETAQLHELSIAPLRERFHTGGFLLYPWIVPAAVGVAVLGVMYLRFLARLPRTTRRLLLLAGAVYVGGAIGVEALSGKEASLQGEHNLTYHMIITVEELLEMTGVIIFIYALLDYIGRQFPVIRLHVAGQSDNRDR